MITPPLVLAPQQRAPRPAPVLTLVPDLTPASLPPVSVFMAVRDEAGELVASVSRILAQDYPGEVQVVVAVAPSRDDTWRVATALAEREPRVKVVSNPAGTTPHGLNAALAAARHDYLVRVDGHAFLPADYLRDVVTLLERTEAANVGGRMLPEGDGPVSRAIALTMSSRIGIGGGAFHVGGAAGPQPTVYLGAFRRDAVTAVGGYDEYFLRAQDWELNHRLRLAGHTVWFDPSLGVAYRPRARWRDFARQQFRTGGWRRRVIERHQDTASVRYLAPPVAVLAVVLGLLAGLHAPLLGDWLVLGLLAPAGYLAGVLGFGLAEARRLPWRVRWRVPIALALMHLSWGTGFLLRSR
ncbi:glycosyltransferase family 2 protein [Nocardioides marmoriginsengisoli]|uniref:Glycosyltransferase family 2 protein n=2 Tax=Nocardioides marmoriginsengisoli TaxID=661483 RepID=A0A3N0CLL9_9ACTN|nr:glycosyltransferase family 2 protein [Nocardioides marmoriginsengisoli]